MNKYKEYITYQQRKMAFHKRLSDVKVRRSFCLQTEGLGYYTL
jgi:hypothetical protein